MKVVRESDDHPKEACGVFGVYAPGLAVSYLTFDGLFALQHRGQESAGMAVSDGRNLWTEKDMGLVSNVFNDYKLAALQGHLAIGLTRYSTTGSSTWRNAQPSYRDTGDGGFALGHNGNLTNTADLAAGAGMLPGTVTSDSDLIAELLAHAMPVSVGLLAEGLLDEDPPVDEDAPAQGSSGRLEAALLEVLPRLRGAFSLVLCDVAQVIGVRDPNGFRPLCLGLLPEGGWVLASETPALDVVGAHFVRELEPGEMVVIDDTGCRSLHPFAADTIQPRLCIFEFVYFARPDSELYGKEVHGARLRMGELLADQWPLPPSSSGDDREAMVMGVPDSGIPAAEGFARRSGIPYGQGLVKNRYMGRTFMAPDQHKRDVGVRRKLNPLHDAVAGKRLVVVEDSIVRGTTLKQIVRLLREAGAAEVHLRVASPPYKWPCFYGMDTGTRGELMAANLSVGEIRDFFGCDTLAYLSIENLLAAIDAPGAGFCTACLTGEYPVAVPASLHKGVLETLKTGG
jgi:amidophosphoribosyltransferase